MQLCVFSVVYTISQHESPEENTLSKIELVKKLSPHREAVRSLINITGMLKIHTKKNKKTKNKKKKKKKKKYNLYMFLMFPYL